MAHGPAFRARRVFVGLRRSIAAGLTIAPERDAFAGALMQAAESGSHEDVEAATEAAGACAVYRRDAVKIEGLKLVNAASGIR